jgi:uncharacterized protein with von Willebrand factor type A (vWA) domain
MISSDLTKVSETAKSRLKPLSKPNLNLREQPKSDHALIILLDVSGSMSGLMSDHTTKLHAAWQAFKSELEPHLTGWDLGILLFGVMEREEVQWILQPTNRTMLDSIREPTPEGSTPMWKALETAWEWIARRTSKARIILITDGMLTDKNPEKAIKETKTNWPIDTVFVGGEDAEIYDIDQFSGSNFLKQLSEKTGGKFSLVSDIKAFGEVIKQLAPENRPLLGSGK